MAFPALQSFSQSLKGAQLAVRIAISAEACEGHSHMLLQLSTEKITFGAVQLSQTTYMTYFL